MTIDAGEASAALADIDAIVRKVKQSAIYRSSSEIFVLWGALVLAGNLISLLAGRWTPYIWIALDALGAVATVAILMKMRQGAGNAWRMVAAYALFFGFGFVWSVVLGGMRARELDAFWPTLFMFGYALAGLWFGRIFTALGVGLTALVVFGYFWIDVDYNLYLAVVNGGGLILCGYAMRRA